MLDLFLKEKEKFTNRFMSIFNSLINTPKYTSHNDIEKDDKIKSNKERFLKILLIYFYNFITNSSIIIIEKLFKLLSK